MDAPPNLSSPQSAGPITLALAIGSVALLYAGLSALNPYPIADEGGHHLHAIRQFYEGDWTWPEHLPMLPTYHVIAAGICKVFGARLFILRAFSMVMAILAILVFRGITRHHSVNQRDDALLHFAWHPILFPFLVLVYTDVASTLGLLGAVYLHVRRRLGLSAGVLLLACLLRQSNVVWVAFMGAWVVAELVQQGRRSVRTIATCVGPHLVIILAGMAYFIVMGGASPATVEANRPRFNIAQFYLFAMFVILLWAPIWIARLADDWRALFRWGLAYPAKGATGALLGMVLIAGLTVAFDNPHPWNHNLDYLRNWPLMFMTGSHAARAAAAVLILAFALPVVRFTLAQPARYMLGLVWLFSFLFLLPHSLAEPRYYMVPVLLMNLFARYGPAGARRLTVWYLLLSAGAGIMICVAGHPGGGVW